MKILIGADFVPTEKNIEYFQKGNIDYLLGDELVNLLSKADFRIFNLETPLTDKLNPIKKYGPHLNAPTAAISGYKAADVNLLTLANNHIFDHGIDGLNSTVDVLNKSNIAYLGAGNNSSEASKPYVFEIENKKIGVYACAEHEFSIATPTKAGANPFDALEAFDHVSALKEKTDYLIVLYHGGKEHYRYPSPNLQAVCRKFVDKGADLVVCQHSHCIGCEEKYNDGTIVYGQGNFLFDAANNEYWNSGLLIEVDGCGQVSYIPITKKAETVRLAIGEDRDRILQSFYNRSEEIKDNAFVQNKYNEYASGMLEAYLINISKVRNNIFFRVINKLTGYRFATFYAKRYALKMGLTLENYLDCEAHRELFLCGLRQINQ